MRDLEHLEPRRLLTAYSLLDLGTLGGTETTAYDINNSNEVVGGSLLATGNSRAFLFKDQNGDGVADPGEMVNLGILAGNANSYAYGINDNGVPVGTSVSSAGAKRAVRFQAGGSVTDLGLGNGSLAYDINQNGQIVGGALFNGISYRAFHRSPAGTVTDLGALSPSLYSSSEAWAISEGGTVAGWTNVFDGDNGFVKPAGGEMTGVGFADPPPGYQYDYAWDVSGLGGYVVGEGFTADNAYHGFRYDGTTVQDLGVLDGYVSSMALGVNDNGQVVGRLKTESGQAHAFYYDGTVMRDLNDLIPAASGWVLTEARAINNAGAIVANGTSPTGQTRAVLLTPPPDATPPAVQYARFAYEAAPRKLEFRFSEDVSASLDAGDLAVTDVATGQPVPSLTLTWDPAHRAAIITFTQDPAAANYRATLSSAAIADASGNTLDGNGDGLVGGDYTFDFWHLPGDLDRNRSVEFADLLAVAQN